MTKGFLRLALFLTGSLYFSLGFAQDEDCLERMDNAEILYNSGIFEDIPLLLEECLETFSEENRKIAYRLIILAYYMNDDVESAENTMRELLSAYPEYKPPVGSEADFQFVFESFRVRKIMDIGFIAGPLLTPGVITEPYSPFRDQFSYNSRLPGISAGALINFPVTSFFAISTEPAISQYSFHIQYDNKINGIYSIDQTERNIMLNLPLHARFIFLEDRIHPYVMIGGELGYLLSSETESKLERFDPQTGELLNASESIKRDHSAYRESLNWYIGGGVGLKMDFNKFYLFSEVDYKHPLNKMLDKNTNRYDQINLWSNAWVDSDFRIIHVFVRFGIARRIYSIKKIR